MKIAFIGGGNMAQAMLTALLKNQLASPQEITISDVDSAKLSKLESQYHVRTTTDNLKAIEDKDIIILAIKPQILAQASIALKGKIKPAQLIISILAGKSLKTLSTSLNQACLVRSMPNTPAQIGEGITVWTATPAVNAQQKKWAGEILGTMGTEIFVAEEKYLDMATAVSGSGPAYVFLFIEALVSAAEKLGFAPEIAQKLVLQTLSGSIQLLQKSGQTPQELRRLVTSPGGTTAAAITTFEQGGFAQLVEKAVRAAYEKAQILGG